MRRFAVLVIPLIACGAPGQSSDKPDAGPVEIDGGVPPPPARGFQLTSPNVDIDPGMDVTYCWYFHTSNAVDMAIKRWSSHMTPGSHDLILYLTASDQQPPNTLSTTGCAIASGAV